MGAGVIAVVPVEPVTTTEVRTASAAVQLTAAPNPFEYYPQVLGRSLSNAGDRLDEYFADPLPILAAIAGNQLRAFDSIVGAVVSLDPVAVVRAVLHAVTQPAVNLARVLSTGEPFATAASFLVRLALPVVSGVYAAGAAIGDAVEALFDLDIVGAVNAVINLPARIVDGFLNGFVDGENPSHTGLLDPVLGAPAADELTGPFAFLIKSLQEIGETTSTTPSPLSTADALPPVSQPPAPQTSVVTLAVAEPVEEAAPDAETPLEAEQETETEAGIEDAEGPEDATTDEAGEDAPGEDGTGDDGPSAATDPDREKSARKADDTGRGSPSPRDKSESSDAGTAGDGD